MTRRGDWMQTYSGVQFYPLDPRPNEVRIEDIAHALSNQCRFAGHTKKFYSVAEHSVHVSYVCDPVDALWGLLHDATEAFLVDVPTPLKKYLAEYATYEMRMQECISARFSLPDRMPASVKKADSVLLATEARDLLGPAPAPWHAMEAPLERRINPLDARGAELLFLHRFAELGGAS